MPLDDRSGKDQSQNIRLLFQAILYSAIKRNRGYELTLSRTTSLTGRESTLPLKEIEDTNALLQLASAFYSKADTYRATVEKIIETVHSHTFAVELAAKLLENAFPYMDNYNYHKGMNGIIQELTGLLKTKNIGTIYLMTANLPQAKTHFKRAFKIYEKIWADEPEMIEAKYQEIQELYPQVGFCIGKNLSGLLTK